MKCPYCGGKSEISRPHRIELPTGVAGRRGGETPVGANNPSAVPPPDEAAKPKLKLIRPSGETALADDPLREKRLRETAEHAHIFEEHRNQEVRRKAMSRVVNVAILVALVLLGGVGYLGWTLHRERQERRQIELMIERERHEKEIFEQEKQRAKEREEAEKKRQQALAVQRENERKQREAEQKRLEAERKLRLDSEQKLRESERQRQAKAEGEARAAKEMYLQVIQQFRTGSLGFYNSVPEDQRPGKAEGEFFYLLPFSGKAELAVTVAKSTKDGFTEVYDLDSDGTRTPRDAKGFAEMLEGRDYLVSAGDQVRFHSKRRKQHVGTIGKKEPAVLANEFFGDIAPEVKLLKPSFEELSFEVVFMPAGSKKPIIVKEVVFGTGYAMEEVRDAICEAFPPKAVRKGTSKAKPKKFKRTVVFWDGAMIKRGIDGVTYVPRVAPLSATTSYYSGTRVWGSTVDINSYERQREKRYSRAKHNLARYESLREAAEREDQAEREFIEAQARQREGVAQEAQNAADRAYADRIAKIFKEGQLFFRARITDMSDKEIK